MIKIQVDCPSCAGTGRIDASTIKWKTSLYGYDKETDTLLCTNCGGQYMYGRPTGKVNTRADGTPCKHEYTSANVGRCLNRYTCKHCGDVHTIDSGD